MRKNLFQSIRPAFSLIELMIVLIIIGILSVALALGYRQMSLSVRFDKHVANIERIFQDARTRSLSTVLIDGVEPTEYYIVELYEINVTLTAIGDTLEEEIETFEFDDDISMDGDWEVYYFPPDGKVCLGNHNCTRTTTEYTGTLEDTSGLYSTTFTISDNGGYLQVD